MDFLSKKRQLEEIIDNKLIPLIDNDYVLYGLPYYTNIGDTLIWNGEIELLKKVPYKCIEVCAWDKYPNQRLPENVIILITGGGFFGDLWRNTWESALNGIKPNKKNKIIILPSTVYYQDQSLRIKDANFLAEFPNLKICTRDKTSYEYVSRYFRNEALLVPDMAFHMNERYIKKWAETTPEKNVLLFKRTDKECPESDINIPETDYDTHDWLSMEGVPFRRQTTFYRLLWRIPIIGRFSTRLAAKLTHFLYYTFFRKGITELGCKQLAEYKTIYTTRLHAMILGTLLNREIVMIDNRFGKLSSYYNTWLIDCDNIRITD